MFASWKKSYDQPREHIKKQRNNFANRGLFSQSYGFSSNHVRRWGLDHKEGWALKNGCFWIVVLEKTLESPLTVRKLKQSILKEINLEYSLEGVMLKLKLQYFGHLMWRAYSSGKRPWYWERSKAGGEGNDRGWDGWMASSTQWKWVWANSGRRVKDRKAWRAAVHKVVKSLTRLSDWTMNNNIIQPWTLTLLNILHMRYLI